MSPGLYIQEIQLMRKFVDAWFKMDEADRVGSPAYADAAREFRDATIALSKFHEQLGVRLEQELEEGT